MRGATGESGEVHGPNAQEAFRQSDTARKFTPCTSLGALRANVDLEAQDN